MLHELFMSQGSDPRLCLGRKQAIDGARVKPGLFQTHFRELDVPAAQQPAHGGEFRPRRMLRRVRCDAGGEQQQR